VCSILSTDDFGVFNSSLTQEWIEMTKAFQLNKKLIRNLMLNATQYCFLPSDHQKLMLRKNFEKWFDEMYHNN